MIQPLLSNATWLSLSPDTRLTIRTIFNIPRSGHVEVFDGKVFCDGTMLEDLMLLTVEKMQAHLNSTETDFNKLFNLLVESIEKPVVKLEETPNKTPDETPKKNKRAAK